MKTVIKKYEFKLGLPVEFEIVSLNDLYKTHREVLANPHRAGFYHILWFQKGHPMHLVDFKPVAVSTGTFLFLNKDTVQRFDINEDFEGEAILFTESFFCQTGADVK